MPHHPKVLVVDDDANIISAFEDFLRKEQCTMISASSAEEAYVCLTHHPVDLVITDVRMKWESGATFLMRIRQSRPKLPIIVITGYPNLISEEDIRQYGADYYFVKPLELDQLREAVRALLQRSRDQREWSL